MLFSSLQSSNMEESAPAAPQPATRGGGGGGVHVPSGLIPGLSFNMMHFYFVGGTQTLSPIWKRVDRRWPNVLFMRKLFLEL